MATAAIDGQKSAFTRETGDETETMAEVTPSAPAFRDTATPRQRYERSVAVMQAEVGHRIVFYKVLKLVGEHTDEDDLIPAIAALPEMHLDLRTPRFYLDALYDAGALDRETLVCQEDDSFAAPMPTNRFRWAVNEIGNRVLDDLSPTCRLHALHRADADLADAYDAVLSFCGTPRARRDVEKMLKERGLICDLNIAASYYLDRLEEAGGLVWGKGWKTTEEGEAYLEEREKAARSEKDV